jgi:uncharacterized membrane protein YbaN (DUF454 family)
VKLIVRAKGDQMPLGTEGNHSTFLKRVARLAIGWSFIVAGMAGLFLPLLQGVLFLMSGLVILSKEYCWAGRLIARVRCRFPAAYASLTRARSRASKILGW